MARSIWKRWFRFSLRTLLLAVLLIGSGALLWWNWGPWAPAFSVEAPTPIQDVIFSPDDRFVVFSSWDGDPEAKETKHRLDIRHAASGAMAHSGVVRCPLNLGAWHPLLAVLGS